MNNNQIPQPPVRNYNPIRIMWTDVECEFLLNQRMARNQEFWELGSGVRLVLEKYSWKDK